MPTSPKDLRKKVEAFPWNDWITELRDEYGDLYEDGAVLGAEISLGADEALELSDPFVSKFMTSYVGERIKSLTETTKDRIIDLIVKALDEGESKSPRNVGTEILDTIQEQFDGYARWRADLIGRTETGFAFNHGTVLGADQAGFAEVDVADGDSDPECEEANGAVWTIDEALANPLEHPNCVRSFAPHVE